MSNKYNKFITALFCTFLGGMLVVSTLLPDKEMSELENRYLQKPPKFSVETVTDGTFMEQAEDYVADISPAGTSGWPPKPGVSVCPASGRTTGSISVSRTPS